MSWNTRFQEASFRGIAFHIKRSPAKFGRNKIVHEFPYSEKPIVEDTGKSTQRFPIEGFVIGDDYDLTRDQLIKAVEKPGPGKLIHPYLGIKSVECLEFEVDESFRDGNYARLRFEFIEAGDKDSIFGFVDKALELIDDAKDYIDNIILDFEEVFSVLSAPAYVVASAASLVDKAGDFVLSKNGLGAIQSSVSDLSIAVNGLKQESKSLVRSPDLLASRTLESITALGNSFSGKVDGIRAVTGVSETKLEGQPSLFNTATRRKEQANRKAYEGLIRAGSIGVAAILLSDFLRSGDTAASRIGSGDIIAIRDEIIGNLESVLRATDSINTYRSLLALKTSLLESIPGSFQLPETTSITLDRDMSVYQLSYRLYGSIQYVDELVQRNQLSFPSLIPQGTRIEYVK